MNLTDGMLERCWGTWRYGFLALRRAAVLLFSAELCCVWGRPVWRWSKRPPEHEDGWDLGPWQQHWANKAKPACPPSPFSLCYNKTPYCISCFQLEFSATRESIFIDTLALINKRILKPKEADDLPGLQSWWLRKGPKSSCIWIQVPGCLCLMLPC